MSDLQVFPSTKEKPKYRKCDCENGFMQFRDVDVSRFSSCAACGAELFAGRPDIKSFPTLDSAGCLFLGHLALVCPHQPVGRSPRQRPQWFRAQKQPSPGTTRRPLWLHRMGLDPRRQALSPGRERNGEKGNLPRTHEDFPGTYKTTSKVRRDILELRALFPNENRITAQNTISNVTLKYFLVHSWVFFAGLSVYRGNNFVIIKKGWRSALNSPPLFN